MMEFDVLKSKLLAPVQALNITDKRLRTCLKNENILYVGEILSMREKDLRAMPNFGPRSLRILNAHLIEFGLPLGSVEFKSYHYRYDSKGPFKPHVCEDQVSYNPMWIAHVSKAAAIAAPPVRLQGKFVLAAMPEQFVKGLKKQFAQSVADKIAENTDVVACSNRVSVLVQEVLSTEIQSLGGFGRMAKCANDEEGSRPVSVWREPDFILSYFPPPIACNMSAEFKKNVAIALLRNKDISSAVDELSAVVSTVAPVMLKAELGVCY